MTGGPSPRPGRDAAPGRRPLDPTILRRTLLGAGLGALLFAGVAAVQAIRSGVALGSVIQPVLVFAVLGLTTGGLAGPLVGAAFARLRARRG